MEPAPMDFRRYLAVIARLAGGLIVFVAALNFWVDPHAYFGRNHFGYYTTAELQFKLQGLRLHPESAVLLGDSKTAMTDAAKIAGPLTFFNAGLGGARIEEIQAMLGRVAPGAPLVVVALDFLQFRDDKPLLAEPLPPLTMNQALGYLFSRKTFGYSLKTLASAAAGEEPVYRDDGTFVATGWYKHYDHENPTAYARMLDNREAELRHFRFNPDRLAGLEKLRAALEARGQPYLVYILPLNTDELRRLRRAGLGPGLDAWRAQVRAVFPQAADLTDSPYGDPKNFFRQDLLHFYPDAGADMISREVLPRLPEPRK